MRKTDILANFSRIRKTVFQFLTSISVASMLQSIVIFAFIFAMSHYSNVEEYAEYRKTFYVIDFSTAISLFGLGTLILRKPLKSLYNDILPIVIIINTIQLISVTVFMFIQHFTLIRFVEMVVFIALNTAYQLCVSVIVIKNARKLYFCCTTFCLLFTIICLVLFVHFEALTYFNAYAVRIAVLLFYIIPFLLMVGTRIRNIRFPSFKHILELFKEAAPIGLGVLLGSCTQYIDKFIASMMDAYQLAVYANASASIPFVGTAISTMSVFFVPIIHKCYSEKNYVGASENMSSLFLYGWYIGVSVFTMLFCNAEFVVELLYSNRYAESVVLFRIFCAGYLLRIASFTQIIVALELENIIIKRMLVEMILQFVLSFLLLKLFGTVGLALSVILVLGLWSVPYNVVSFKRRLKCRYLDLLPIKSMLLFFLKAFIPCFIIAIIMNRFVFNRLIVFVVTALFYFLINFKEIIYIIRKTR